MSNIESKFKEHCNRFSDINEHLPVLAEYAAKCEHVTEMGVRGIVSTWALLMGKPKKMISIDIVNPDSQHSSVNFGSTVSQVKELALQNSINYHFIQGNTLDIDIEPTDLLFIDTIHRYSQLRQELEKHAKNVNKYIILHDIVSYENTDENQYFTFIEKYNDKKGLKAAVEYFLEQNKDWKIEKIFLNNNGLLVLNRIVV
jgi:hypothetical protein